MRSLTLVTRGRVGGGAQPLLRVAPGVEEVAQIHVRPHRPLWFGAPSVHSFSLEAVGEGRDGAYVDGQDGAHVEGQLTQVPLIPRWVVRAAALAIPLVAALLVFLHVTATTAVPDLGHVSKNVAEQKLRAAGFLFKESTSQADVVPVDGVISQDPVGGSHKHHGSTITLLISAGPTPAAVPDVIGEDQVRAQADLLRPPGRFVIDQTIQRADATAPRGTVVDTDPRRSQLAAPGSAVTLFLSSGPSPAASPPTVAAPTHKPSAGA
ncbi:MAG: PASTA domain-containing protein, partial [Actinobacteria bacterium]